MRHYPLAFILMCFALQSMSCMALAQEPDLDIQPFESAAESAEETMEYEQIKNKLLTNLFFRGELADKIIEANLHNKLIKFSGGETYSEIRTELIKWIGQHPEEAARLFMHLKSGTGDFMPDETPTRITRWEIHPFFLGLAKDLIAASKDKSLSDEALSMASKRLFEGMLHTGEQIAITEQNSKIQQTIGTDFFYSDYADFKINTKTLDKEHKLITNMFEQTKILLENDLPATKSLAKDENSVILAKREDLFKQTFQMYQNFLITFSSLKGRKNITKKESDLIEKERHGLRENLALLHALSRIYELNLQHDVLLKNPVSNDLQNILGELLNLKQLFMEYVSSLENTQMRLSQIYAELRSIEKLLFNWTIKFIIYDQFVRMKMSIENMNFSCVLDRTMSDYLMKFFPMSNYAKTKNEILEFSGILDTSIKEISAGNFENAFNLMAKNVVAPRRSDVTVGMPDKAINPQKTDMVFEKIRNVNAKIQMISDFSKFNKNIQFIFWDMFFNPFTIKYEHLPEHRKLKISNFSIELKTLSFDFAQDGEIVEPSYP